MFLLRQQTEIGVAVLRKKPEKPFFENGNVRLIWGNEYYKLAGPEEKIFTVLVVLKSIDFYPPFSQEVLTLMITFGWFLSFSLVWVTVGTGGAEIWMTWEDGGSGFASSAADMTAGPGCWRLFTESATN